MFVSYAQNYEDVLLWRALGHIQNGLYIDVGACEPEADSVTKAFYDRGWSGINIEPMPHSYRRLAAARPRDTNLNIALEDTAGHKTYFAVDGGNGMSTGVQIARDKLASEGARITEMPVTVSTLQKVCEEHVNGDIHFLKIDVEGLERWVMRGGDWTRFRPWVLMAEAAELPDGFPKWHDEVTARDYVWATHDGVNAVYVAAEHQDLLPALRMPPNLHDHFVTAREAALDDMAAVLGLPAGTSSQEIMARLNGLFADRIKYEIEANELRMSSATPNP